MFHYCPKCKSKLKEDKANHFLCNNCNFNFYTNPNPAVAVIILNKKRQICLVKRARKPKYGFWDLPGGFIKFGETAEEAARREAKEETGLDLSDLKYLCSFTNEYYYKGTQYYPLDLYFLAVADVSKIKSTDERELSEGRFFNIEDLPVKEIAFESAKRILSILADDPEFYKFLLHKKAGI